MIPEQNKEDHDSYGAITFTHQHGNARPVFGSPVQHTDIVNIQINSAKLLRSLSQDHILTDEVIFSGYMSQAQLAQALFAMSNGPPTPITIDYVIGDTSRRPETPQAKDMTQQFEHEIASLLERILNDCENLANSTKGKIRNQAMSIKQSLENNIPFIRERMRENLHHVADQAKRDFDSYRERTIRQAGLDAMMYHHPSPPTLRQYEPRDDEAKPEPTGTDHVPTNSAPQTLQESTRILETHHGDLVRRLKSQVPPELATTLMDVSLEPTPAGIETKWVFKDGVTLPGPRFQIDQLIEQFQNATGTNEQAT